LPTWRDGVTAVRVARFGLEDLDLERLEFVIGLDNVASPRVAEQSGATSHPQVRRVQTLRYYERRGLLPEPPRRESGYPIYGSEAVRIVRFIKRAQRSASDSTRWSRSSRWPPAAPSAARRISGWPNTVSRLDQRIADLRAMRGALQRLLATCTMPSVGRGVDRWHAAEVKDHHLGLLLNALQQALGEAGSAS
jgi:hypothetical protein